MVDYQLHLFKFEGPYVYPPYAEVKVTFAFFHSEMSENNSKQVSEQSKDICLTSNFESNNPVYTSKNSKMLISSQWATLKMFKKNRLKRLITQEWVTTEMLI